MAGLEGTIKTPLGTVQKKTALILGGGILVLGMIVYYRQKQTASENATPADAPINPATGYPYGSPEDAAALAEQAGYVSPPASSGGGGSNIPPSNVGYATNGQWVQGVIQTMTANGSVTDTAPLSAALGKYITGAYANDAEVSLIQQAIAVEGYPPVAGSNGYPPSLNRTPPTTTPPVTMKAPTGIKQTRVDHLGVSLDWSPLTGVQGYRTFVNGKQAGNSVLYSNAYVSLPKAGTTYTVGVAGIYPGGKVGPVGTTRVTTKK